MFGYLILQVVTLVLMHEVGICITCRVPVYFSCYFSWYILL